MSRIFLPIWFLSFSTGFAKSLENHDNILLMKSAKYFLFRGELSRAERVLDYIKAESVSLHLIKKRYLAMIEFARGAHQKSLEHLEDSRFNSNLQYPHVCMLKVVNLLLLDDKRVEKEFLLCQKKTLGLSKNEQFWPVNLIKIKRASNVEKVFLFLTTLYMGNNHRLAAPFQLLNRNDYIKIWFKLGLYLNQEKRLESLIAELPKHSYQSERLKELIGMVYHRLGKDKQAVKFVEGISSLNAENIRGNNALKNKQYQKAFEHFQSALQKRKHSPNALERAIPLAWILEKWDAGPRFITFLKSRKPLGQEDSKEENTLEAAFLIKQENFARADDKLRLVQNAFYDQTPLSTDIMAAYTSFRLGHQRRWHSAASRNCRRFDGLSCWSLFQSLTWGKLRDLAKQEKKILPLGDFDPEKYKESFPINPLQETKIVEQKRIEELDLLDSFSVIPPQFSQVSP